MPRDSSGNYTLPSGNPVITGSIIASSWANTTLNDLATEMTDSLSRSGKGGMNAAFKVLDGTVSLPGLAFSSEPGSGMYRIGAADVGFAITGALVLELTTGGVDFHQPVITAVGTTALQINGNATGSLPDVLINANSSNEFALRIKGPTGQGLIQSYLDGNTGNQEWLFTVGKAGTGIFVFKDNITGTNVFTISPTTDWINFNTPIFVNSLANDYGLQINGSSTTGQSQGLTIHAGTNSSDNALLINNQANTVGYFTVRGDGYVFITDAAVSSPGGYKAGFRGAPPNVQGGAYTPVVSDGGKSIVFTAAATCTLPSSVFSEGDMLIIVAQGGVVTIAAGSGVTLNWANGSATTGSRTLTNIGIATVWWASATVAYITGSGLS